jgi:hypothetical protein
MGAALSIAKASPSAELAPWQFAIERVRRHGVDVDTWTAADHLWRGAA